MLLVILIAVTFSGLVLISQIKYDDQPKNQTMRFENKRNQTVTFSYRWSDDEVQFEIGSGSDGQNNEPKHTVHRSIWFINPDNGTQLINYYIDEDDFTTRV